MSLQDKLSSYKLNSAYTEGVDFALDEAPDVVFRVILPGQFNRAYMADLYNSMDIDVDDDGTVNRNAGNLVETSRAQEVAFMEHCLVSIDGEPAPEDFLTEYPKAVRELIEKANEATLQLEGDVENAVKKSALSSVGSKSGATG